MEDFKEDIKSVCAEHGRKISEEEAEEINTALNDLVTDYVANDDMDEDEAISMISDNFWDFVRNMLDD